MIDNNRGTATMTETLYRLSNATLSANADLDGLAIEFLHTSDGSRFYLAYLICVRQNGVAKNALLLELLTSLGIMEITGIDPAPFVDAHVRIPRDPQTPAPNETWGIYTFAGASSPLQPFASGSILVVEELPDDDDVDEIDGERERRFLAPILIIESGETGPGLHQPTAFRLLSTLPGQISVGHSWFQNRYTLDADPIWQVFAASTDPVLALRIELQLPYSFTSPAPSTIDERRLHLTYRHTTLNAFEPILFNQRPARPVDNALRLRTEADADAMGQLQWRSPSRLLLFTSTSDTIIVPWDSVGTHEVHFTGTNLAWEFSESSATKVVLTALDESEFVFHPKLSLVSQLDAQNKEFDLVHSAVLAPRSVTDLDRGTDAKTLDAPLGAVRRNGGGDLLELTDAAPQWLVDNDDLTFRLIPTRVLVDGDPYPKLSTTLGVNLTTFFGESVDPSKAAGRLRTGLSLLTVAPQSIESFVYYVPCELSGLCQSDSDRVELQLRVVFDLREMKAGQEVHFRVRPTAAALRVTGRKRSLALASDPVGLDFGLLFVELPKVVNTDDDFNAGDSDGTLNLVDSEFLLNPQRRGNDSASQVRVYLPGGIGFRSTGAEAYRKRRFELNLNKITLDGGTSFLLRANRSGVTLDASVNARSVTLLDEPGLRKNIEASPVPTKSPIAAVLFEEQLLDRRRAASPFPSANANVAIWDNQVRRGLLEAHMIVPGTDDLQARATARFTQGNNGVAKFSAGFFIDDERDKPVCNLAIGFFLAQTTRPRLGLEWTSDAGGKWTLSAIVDANLSVKTDVALRNGLAELRSFDSIVLKDIDLLRLSFKTSDPINRVTLRVRKFAFSVFGLVGINLDGLKIDWNDDGVTIRSDEAQINFGNVGQTSGGISLGMLTLKCERGAVDIKEICGAGVQLSVPGKFDFSGRVTWESREGNGSYFALEGRLATFSRLVFDGLLKYGSDVKRNGTRVNYLVAYAARGNLNKPVPGISALVWQQGGIGAGYNAQLGQLSRDPSIQEIMDKIDTLEPSRESEWHFVPEDGTYLSVVAKLGFTSQIARFDTICGYVLSIVASVDTTGRIIAAGKLWLFSSQKHSEENYRSPSLVAVLCMDMRRPSLTFCAKTRRGGSIQAFPQLREILDRVDATLTVRLTPELFDIYLDPLTYQQTWLGATFQFAGSWRFSVFRETMLQYVRAKVSGKWSPGQLGDDRGGFKFEVDIGADLEYGGLIGRAGVMTWGEVSMEIHASCTAFLKYEYEVPYIECRGLKSSIEYRTVSETLEMPRATVGLGVSGKYAFRGDGGIEGGAVLRVSFDRHFCGQRLSISPEFSINSDLLDEVRNKVRSFEAQLDRVAAQTRKSQLSSIVEYQRRRATPLDQPSLIDRLSRLQNDPEEWIVVENQDASTERRWAIVPGFSSPWLTPKFKRKPPRADGQEFETLEFDFQEQVVEIQYSDAGAQDVTIQPFWDQSLWGSFKFPERPEDADPDLLRMLNINTLFSQSALEVGSQLRAMSDSTPKSLAAYHPPVEDLRPINRLRDALRDEDRLMLPIHVYPFTYRPSSAPNYEAMARDFENRRLGPNRLDQADARDSARGAILSMIREELVGRGSGMFSVEHKKPTDAQVSFAPYIQLGDYSTATPFKVRRDGGYLTDIRVLRVTAGGSAKVSQGHFDIGISDIASRIKLCEPCQEFVPSQRPSGSQDAGPSTDLDGKVVVKLPISFTELFDAINVDGETLKTTWFELIDFVRVYRKLPGEKEFRLVGDRLDLPAEIHGDDVLCRPFIFTDVTPVPAGIRAVEDRTLEQVEYRLEVIPVGRESSSTIDPPVRLHPDGNKQRLIPPIPQIFPFPVFEPFVPGVGILSDDLGIAFAFDDEKGGLVWGSVNSGNSKAAGPIRLVARLVHTSSGTADGELTFDDELGSDRRLNLDAAEFFYEEFELEQNGFYSQTVTDETATRAQDLAKSRASRVSEEASGRQLRSRLGLKPLAVCQVGDRLWLPALPERFSYRLFIGQKSRSELLPVQELPVFLVRGDDRREWGRPLSVPQLEIPIPRKLDAPARVVAVPKEATADDLQHRVLTQVAHPSDPQLGGFEAELIDDDEDRVLERRRIEVLKDTLFFGHLRNFADDSEWIFKAITIENIPEHTGARNGPVDRVDVGLLYWDEKRWFQGTLSDNSPPAVASGGFEELRNLYRELMNFASASNPPEVTSVGPDFRELISKIGLFWGEAGRFLADAQNDGLMAVANLDEVRYGLYAMVAGLFPHGFVDDKALGNFVATEPQTFAELEKDYVKQRIAIRAKSLDKITADSTEKLVRLRQDLVAARRLVSLIEARRIFAAAVLDEGTDEVDIDVLQRGLRAQEDVASLPYGDMEREVFQRWLGLAPPNDPAHAGQLAELPLCEWFVRRMVPSDLEDWGDYAAGSKTAELLTAVDGTLNEFQKRIKAPPPPRGLQPPAQPEDHPEPNVVPFVWPINHILAPILDSQVLPNGRFLISRPHHALGLELDEDLSKSPVTTPLTNLIPEAVRTAEDVAKLDITSVFQAFLSFAERMGLGVDVASMQPGAGAVPQQALLQDLHEKLREVRDRMPSDENANWYFAVVRGTAPDDDIVEAAESAFSFVKLLAVPKLLLHFADSGELVKQLDNRRITFDTVSDAALIDKVLAWWNASMTLLFEQAVSEQVDVQRRSRGPALAPALTVAVLEHRGVSWLTIPVVSEVCRIQLPVPSLGGRWAKVKVRSLSRYVLIEEWLAGREERVGSLFIGVPAETNADPVLLRPYYDAPSTDADGRVLPTLECPTAAIGISNGSRIDFLVSHPADDVDSRDNLLTAIRTGFRALGMSFLQRPIDHSMLGSLHVDDTSVDPQLAEVPTTEVTVLLRDDIACFANETLLKLEDRPYFMEASLSLRGIYDSCGERAGPSSPATTFVRRQPVLMGSGRGIVLPPPRLAATALVRLQLLRYEELLTEDESRAFPDFWEVDIEGSAQSHSLPSFPDLRTFYQVQFQISPDDEDAVTNVLLAPRFDVLLPLSPGYQPEAEQTKHGAMVRSIGTGGEDIRYFPFKSFEMERVVRREDESEVRAIVRRYYIEFPVDLPEDETARLWVQTRREGQSSKPVRMVKQ